MVDRRDFDPLVDPGSYREALPQLLESDLPLPLAMMPAVVVPLDVAR
jgi:hypothetical protein